MRTKFFTAAVVACLIAISAEAIKLEPVTDFEDYSVWAQIDSDKAADCAGETVTKANGQKFKLTPVNCKANAAAAGKATGASGAAGEPNPALQKMRDDAKA